MNTISFMEILIEMMAVVGQEYVGYDNYGG